MQAKTISFLCPQNKDVLRELLLVRDELAAHDPLMAFQYYKVKENRRAALPVEGLRSGRQDFLQKSSGLISADPVYANDVTDYRSVMIALPYEHYFAFAEETGQGQKIKPGRDNHLLSTSPFMTKILQERYQVEEGQIAACCSPFAWDLQNKAKIDRSRRALFEYFPQAEGKKILAVLKAGLRTDEVREQYKDFPLRDLLAVCGDDWFVLTNMGDLVDAASALPSRFGEHFGYVNYFDRKLNIPYIADAMVSSCPEHVCTFAGLGRKTLGITYRDSSFETLMTREYPDMFITDPSLLVKRAEQLLYSDETNKAFAGAFCQDLTKNPFDTIRELLGEME